MYQILDGWAQLLKDSRMIYAFNQGYRATTSLLADILDEWVQTAVPAYATAVSICEAMPEQVYDCDKKRKEIRDAGFRELLEATKLDNIIHQALKYWRRLPAALRENAGVIVGAGADIIELYEDPSYENALAAMSHDSDVNKVVIAPLLRKIGAGEYLNSPVYKYALKVAAMDAEDITNWLSEQGVKLTDEAVEAVEGFARKHLGNTAGTLVGLTAGAITDPIGTAGDLLDSIGL